MNWPLIAGLAITVVHIWAIWSLVGVWHQDEYGKHTDDEDFE